MNDRPLRPFYLMVVFWGKAHRKYFTTLLLPSLLAPGNLPAIQSVAGSKLLICTTKEDWAALEHVPLLAEARKYVDPVLIEIDVPLPEANKYLHSAAGFKRAVRKCREDGAYGSFMVPDMIFSDGTLKHLHKLAAHGVNAALGPALRYDQEACLAALRARGLLKENRPISVSGRELVAIGLDNLHSEIKRFEWNSPSFCRHPFSVWWRSPGRRTIILYATGWQMSLVNFHALPTLNDSSLDYTTQDDVFIDQNFYRFKDEGTLHLITDSDDVFYLSVTSETESSFYPLQQPLFNKIPVIGPLVKFSALQLFMNSRMFDAFRRWAVTVPHYIHADPLTEADLAYASTTTPILLRAVQLPGLLLRLYDNFPTRALLFSYVVLGFKDPRQFMDKLWRRLSGRRKGAISRHEPN